MKKAVTIKEIAERLNLSRNTVAKALNGQYVPESTRERVLKKAREMNYKGLNADLSEANARNYRILLVSGKPLNNINYFIPLIKGIESFCYEKNYELFQYTFKKERTPFGAFLEYVKGLNVDGIVAIECFEKSFVERLIALGIPICFNDFTATDVYNAQNFDIITTNDEQSFCNIVKQLYKKYGIMRFTFVGDIRHCLSFRERYMGMLKGISISKGEHSRKEDILCNDESFDYGDANAIKTEILKLKFMPECFICCNDFIARSVCHALKALDVAVPDGALVVGYDNVSEAVSMQPAITSFSVDKEFLGRETMRALVQRIESPDIPSRMITVSTSCVFRKSTAR